MEVSFKKAFSLIELVFVILIVGIIAATALPRFTGISEDAHITKLQAFTGTLNRTVGPVLWSNVQKNEPAQNGRLRDSIAYNAITEGVEVETIPIEFIGLGSNPRSISLTTCIEANTTIPEIGDAVGNLTIGKIAGTILIGDNHYALGCIDGSLTNSPRFYFYNETEGLIVY